MKAVNLFSVPQGATRRFTVTMILTRAHLDHTESEMHDYIIGIHSKGLPQNCCRQHLREIIEDDVIYTNVRGCLA